MHPLRTPLLAVILATLGTTAAAADDFYFRARWATFGSGSEAAPEVPPQPVPRGPASISEMDFGDARIGPKMVAVLGDAKEWTLCLSNRQEGASGDCSGYRERIAIHRAEGKSFGVWLGEPVNGRMFEAIRAFYFTTATAAFPHMVTSHDGDPATRASITTVVGEDDVSGIYDHTTARPRLLRQVKSFNYNLVGETYEQAFDTQFDVYVKR